MPIFAPGQSTSPFRPQASPAGLSMSDIVTAMGRVLDVLGPGTAEAPTTPEELATPPGPPGTPASQEMEKWLTYGSVLMPLLMGKGRFAREVPYGEDILQALKAARTGKRIEAPNPDFVQAMTKHLQDFYGLSQTRAHSDNAERLAASIEARLSAAMRIPRSLQDQIMTLDPQRRWHVLNRLQFEAAQTAPLEGGPFPFSRMVRGAIRGALHPPPRGGGAGGGP